MPGNRSKAAALRKPTLVLNLLLFMPLLAQTQATKPTSPPPSQYSPIPVTEARRPNPVKATPESIAEGKRIYGYEWVHCHGASGNGKSEAAKRIKIPDFIDPAVLKDRTDGELFYVINNGRGQMPLEGDRAKPDQLWDLVNYDRSLAKKGPAERKPSL